MDTRIKNLWTTSLDTKELPDGTKITQAKGVLRKKTAGNRRPLCCLGVLCEIAVLEGVIPAPKKEDDDSFRWEYEDEYGKMQYHADEDLLPAVITWAGLDTSNPAVDFKTGEFSDDACLSVLNDDYEKSFKEISDLVKEQL